MLPDENFYFQEFSDLNSSKDIDQINQILSNIQGSNSVKFDNLTNPDATFDESSAFLQPFLNEVDSTHEMLKLIQLCTSNISLFFTRNFKRLPQHPIMATFPSQKYKDLLLNHLEFKFIARTIEEYLSLDNTWVV